MTAAAGAPQPALERRISAALLRLRARAPFFAVLCMFAPCVPSHDVPTARTDGRRILYNPDWLSRLTPEELEAVLLHEVLHAALLHVGRRGQRDPVRWNIAADVVVNGIVAAEQALTLPPGAIREPSLEKLPVEEIYALLEAQPLRHVCAHCLAEAAADGDPLARLREAEAHWRHALAQASAIARSIGPGALPGALLRHATDVLEPTIDWRSALWRYLVKMPCDFEDFDRRLVYRGMYLEALHGDRLEVYVAIDTSGSVDGEMLSAFLAELRGITAAYPQVKLWLFYADAALHGPYELDAASEVPPPVGGGGTSFVPFFARVEALCAEAGTFVPATCVYLTDGFGAFPSPAPELEVLWAVTPGGELSERFPFGTVLRVRP